MIIPEKPQEILKQNAPYDIVLGRKENRDRAYFAIVAMLISLAPKGCKKA